MKRWIIGSAISLVISLLAMGAVYAYAAVGRRPTRWGPVWQHGQPRSSVPRCRRVRIDDPRCNQFDSLSGSHPRRIDSAVFSSSYDRQIRPSSPAHRCPHDGFCCPLRGSFCTPDGSASSMAARDPHVRLPVGVGVLQGNGEFNRANRKDLALSQSRPGYRT